MDCLAITRSWSNTALSHDKQPIEMRVHLDFNTNIKQPAQQLDIMPKVVIKKVLLFSMNSEGHIGYIWFIYIFMDWALDFSYESAADCWFVEELSP